MATRTDFPSGNIVQVNGAGTSSANAAPARPPQRINARRLVLDRNRTKGSIAVACFNRRRGIDRLLSLSIPQPPRHAFPKHHALGREGSLAPCDRASDKCVTRHRPRDFDLSIALVLSARPP